GGHGQRVHAGILRPYRCTVQPVLPRGEPEADDEIEAGVGGAWRCGRHIECVYWRRVEEGEPADSVPGGESSADMNVLSLRRWRVIMMVVACAVVAIPVCAQGQSPASPR